MLAALDQLIRLQRLDNEATVARTRIAALPACVDALGKRLETAGDAVEQARQKRDDVQTRRVALEKDLAAVETRLDRFREQLMQVKTNKEYQAMQVEIATAEDNRRRMEDSILERMLESDDLKADVERAEDDLRAEQATVEAERGKLDSERQTLETRLAAIDDERARLVVTLDPTVLSLFESVAERRNGVAVGQALDGRCAACQIRLRPQLFNEVLSNSRIIQCESCQRVLYFAPETDATA